MSKRKAAKVSKLARSKVASRAQRARQAVVRSRKPRQMRSAALGSTSLAHVDTPADAVVVGGLMATLPVVESPAIASQDESQCTERNDAKASAFPATSNVWAVQTKLPELAQANLKLAFELAQRLTQIKSAFELPSVLSEFPLKQFAILQDIFASPTDLLRREKQGVQ